MRFFAAWIFFAPSGIIVTLILSRTFKLAFALVLTAWLGGCANLAYYTQAVGGQMELLNRAQPISRIIADPNADPSLKRTLAKVVALRAFASRELQLPDNQSYTRYADLKRPFVVWNVFAAPEFSTEPKKMVLRRRGLRQLSRLFL